MKSNAGNGGSFYHSPDPTGGFQEYRDTPVGVIANDDGNEFANDKELMTADSNPSSPKRDNVYMTWTRFNAADHSPIYFSQSEDGGATWSEPIEISGSNADLPAGRRRVQRRPGLQSGRRAGRHDLRVVRQRERARQRHRAGAERDVPGQRRLQHTGELDVSHQGGRHDLHASGGPAEPERLSEQAVPAAERLPRSRRDDGDQLRRRGRERVRDVGGSPQRHEPELRARRGRRRLGAVRPRHLLRVLHRRRIDVERHGRTSRRGRASARPRSGSRGARSRRTGPASGSRSTTGTTATARRRAATTSPPRRSGTRRRIIRATTTPG